MRASLGLWVVLAVVIGAGSSAACRGNDVVLLELPGGGSGDSAGAAGSTTSGGAAGRARGGSAGSDVGGAAAGGVNGGAGGSVASAGGNSAGTPNGGTSGGSSGTAGKSAATAGAGGGVCFDNDDCPSGKVCDKPGCAAESGVCVDYPATCPTRVEPVCGCDNVTYWNDCVRRRNGARKAAEFECSAVIACRTAADCGVEGASCARLLAPHQQCNSADPGKCWVLPDPDRCESPSTLRFGECPPLPQQGAPGMFPQCLDLCGAIRSEKVLIPLPRDAPCGPD